MNSPFSTDKKYVDQHGVDYLYIGFHPARTTHPFVFTRHRQTGVFFLNDAGQTEYTDWTIREVKPKITRWVNIYKAYPLGYPSKEAADKAGVAHRMACIKLEFEEGEGLQDV